MESFVAPPRKTNFMEPDLAYVQVDEDRSIVDQGSSKANSTSKQFRCYRCNQPGHRAAGCTAGMSKKKKPKATDESLTNSLGFTQICSLENNSKSIAELLKENEELKEIIQQNQAIISEKEKLINQLLKENDHLQSHYNLINSNIIEKDTIVGTIDKITKRLENLEKQPSPISYASVANKQLGTPQKSLKKLVIKPKGKQNCSDTKKDLNKNINLSKLQIKIEAVNDTRDGGVELKLQDKYVNILKNEMDQVLLRKYEVMEEKKILPKIKIVGYKTREKPTMEEIKEKLIRENYFLHEEDIRVTYLNYIVQHNYYTIHAEVSG
ncbi:unnamed protein product, partial [Callosobruchus maculatus]